MGVRTADYSPASHLLFSSRSLSPQCTHYFHLMCITTWLHNKNTCPICRRKWEFQTGPKPAPATPGNRRAGEGFSAANPPPPPEAVDAD